MTKQQSTPTFTISPTRPCFVPVLATPAQIIPSADPRDLRAWEANETGAPRHERFSVKGDL